MYLCSLSPRSLAVPGVGYCQSIPVDHEAFDPAEFQVRSPRHGWARIWVDWASQGPAGRPAAEHELH